MKNDKLICKNETVLKKKTKRIGAAKEEMEDFDISLKEFNSIETPDFGN